MRTELVYAIPENDAGRTAASFLKKQGFSHRLLERIKQDEAKLTVNGEKALTTRKLSDGDTLKVILPPEKGDTWITPQEIPLKIVYEDDDLLVIDKDAGLLVHPTPNHPDGTLANALAFYFAKKGEPFTFRTVSRLDQDTSGLLVIPRHALSASILGQDVADRRMKRVYIAIASGDLRDVFPEGEGVIDAPIASVPGQGMLRQVDVTHGESARTDVKLLGYNEKLNVSICDVTLESGRTHQIRVHFQYIGHPLPGDFLYNPDFTLIDRQALHSYQLTFQHPITGEALFFTAPLPEDMRFFLPEGISL